jgi:hypothetical protein
MKGTHASVLDLEERWGWMRGSIFLEMIKWI